MTAEILRLAVDRNQSYRLEVLLDYFPTQRQRDSVIEKCGMDELLGIELDLRPHQHKCYKAIANAIQRYYPYGFGQDVAERLGFDDIQGLEAARSAVRAMFPPDEEMEAANFGLIGGVEFVQRDAHALS